VLTPVLVTDPQSDRVAAVSSTGRLLVHALSELPVRGKGKGQKIMQIPPAKLKSREEYVSGISVVPATAQLTVHAGKRHLSLKQGDLDHYANASTPWRPAPPRAEAGWRETRARSVCGIRGH
jgi:topoisomerase-4 subunit A